MEGPSLVIACEEFHPFVGTRVLSARGSAKLPFREMTRRKLLSVRSWGKHFLLSFETLDLRIHFLMFGSYRIDNPRENRVPKLTLKFKAGTVNFYSCAIGILDQPADDIYDWSIDTMSPKWSTPKALRAVRAKPSSQICDVLMDQAIFAGVGNIIKNEVQFRQRLHPETRVEQLTEHETRDLVRSTRAYCLLFYKWKKAGVLKKNWQIFRKRTCPLCARAVTKKPTGRLERLSHWCHLDQPRRTIPKR